MSRRPFDPNELDQPASDTDSAVGELERYTMDTHIDEPQGLTDRIMASIEHEPTPRRGLLAWLAGSPPGAGHGRFLRVGAVAATLVLAVAGALFAGQLADLVRDVGADVTPSPSPSPSLSPVPSSSEAPSALATPEGSDDNGGMAPTMVPTSTATQTAHPEETPEQSNTPRPSATATASPTSTPTETP